MPPMMTTMVLIGMMPRRSTRAAFPDPYLLLAADAVAASVPVANGNLLQPD